MRFITSMMEMEEAKEKEMEESKEKEMEEAKEKEMKKDQFEMERGMIMKKEDKKKEKKEN